jgi:asparagine synthase (glutamine-hydrolysing)
MFAFALADPVRRQVWFARDRLGIKPLYLFRPAGGGLLFASEVRALLAAGPDLVPRRLDRRAVEAFLSQGAVYGDDAHVAGVRSLPAGSMLTVDWSGRELRRSTYWELPADADAPPTREKAVVALATSAREAVRQHLISDVPVGVLLSGGVDSATITTLATEESAAPVRTVSIGFDVAAHDESSAAERIAAELGSEHLTVRVTADHFARDLDRWLAAMDQPTTDGVNTLYAAQAARAAGVTVVLSGLGGDEVFGGYATFRDVPRAKRLMTLVPPRGLAGPGLRWAGRRFGSRTALKLAEAVTRPATAANLCLLRREMFLPAERRMLFPLPAGSDPLTGISLKVLEDLHRICRRRDRENQVSAMELTGYMRDRLLRDSDVFSLVQGVELRVPLLDHHLVEQAIRLPGAWKRIGPLSKPLLVEAAGPRLPKQVGRGPKLGFVLPWTEWFQSSLAPLVSERLNDRSAWAAIGFDPTGPQRLWTRFLRNDPSVNSYQVLGLLVLADVVRRQGLTV